MFTQLTHLQVWLVGFFRDIILSNDCPPPVPPPEYETLHSFLELLMSAIHSEEEDDEDSSSADLSPAQRGPNLPAWHAKAKTLSDWLSDSLWRVTHLTGTFRKVPESPSSIELLKAKPKELLDKSDLKIKYIKQKMNQRNEMWIFWRGFRRTSCQEMFLVFFLVKVH